jgi:hypothetical protein
MNAPEGGTLNAVKNSTIEKIIRFLKCRREFLMFKRNLFTVVGLCLLFASKGMAWGLLDPTGYWRKATITYKLKQTNTITYAVSVANNDRIDENSISIQAEVAMGLWLNAVPELENRNIRMIQVEKDSDPDLMIAVDFFGQKEKMVNKVDTGVGTHPSGKLFKRIRINLDFHLESNGSSSVEQDVKVLFRNDLGSLKENLIAVSSKKMTLRDIEKINNVERNLAWFNTFTSLIHEIGHTFGLCDMYKENIATCNPDFISPNACQVPSVMREYYFFLQEDDIEGIRKAFEYIK